jgi:hypothetical protein
MNTLIVDPFVGITMSEPSAVVLASGVMAQPKLAIVPATVWPCPGVSSVPNGFANRVVRERESFVGV